MRTRRPLLAVSVAALVAAAVFGTLPRAVRGDASTNGTFRWLTQSLPTGSTNAEYVARLITANADGPVTFTVTGLPSGMTYDAQSGFITGRPTTTFNNNVGLSATDGVNGSIAKNVNLKVNASGGGGNAGSTFGVNALPDGTVGTAYAYTLTVSNGVGPYTFGAADLPPGITLNGETGTLSGAPQAAGTFFVELTVVDHGESNKVVKVVPLKVLPSGSSFQFTTRFLNNGEVGTDFFDQWATSGGSGTVTFGASGLPPGVTVDSTGLVSGMPTVAGTYEVTLTATDAANTITTNLTTIIAPSSSSSFYWDFFGLPTALVGVSYNRQPPILVVAKNGTTVTYSQTGLPSGLLYNTLTGEITGTAVDVGEYPVVFIATDTDPEPDVVLTLSVDFLVLPATGGDASVITINFWPTKQVLKSGSEGNDSWVGQGFWNADRRAANRFDPLADGVSIGIGSHTVTVPAGSLAGTAAALKYATPKGDEPAVSLLLSLTKQTFKWSLKNDTIPEAVPATLRHTTILGGHGWRLDEAFDEAGAFRPALAFRRAAMVCTKGTLSAGSAGSDAAKLSLLLSDPAFAFETPGTSTLRFRILSGATVLLDRDFTALGAGATAVPPGGDTVFTLKISKDTATVDRVAKFSYANAKGKLTLALTGMTLAGVPATEAHLTLELTIGQRPYTTGITFFETSPGKYTTAMPNP